MLPSDKNDAVKSLHGFGVADRVKLMGAVYFYLNE